MGKVDPISSAFGSRGIGNYIHDDFNNYLIWGARRALNTDGINRTENVVEPNKGAGLEHFQKAQEDLKRRTWARLQSISKVNTEGILEDYLTGIFYPGTMSSLIFDKDELANANSVIFDNVNQTLEEMISSTMAKYDNLEAVVKNNSAKNLFLGYLHENEDLRKLELINNKRFFYEDRLLKVQATIISTVQGLMSGSIQSKDADKYVEKLKECQRNINSILKNLKEGTDFSISKGKRRENQRYYRITAEEGNGKYLLESLNEAIKIIRSIEKYNSTVYGDVGEATIASAFGLAKDAANQVVFNAATVASGIKGKDKNFNISNSPHIYMSSFINADSLINERGMSNKVWQNSVGVITAKSHTQETIDIVADIENNRFDLDKKLGIKQITASIKNYSNASNVHLLSGAPLLSILNIGGIDISNHYLNFVGNQNEFNDTSIISFNNVLKFLVAIRSLLGIKDNIHGSGSSVISNDFLIVNNKSAKKIQVVDTKKFINNLIQEMPKEMSVLSIDPLEIDLTNANQYIGTKGVPSAEFAKERIANLLTKVSQIKLSANLDVQKYRL